MSVSTWTSEIEVGGPKVKEYRLASNQRFFSHPGSALQERILGGLPIQKRGWHTSERNPNLSESRCSATGPIPNNFMRERT